MENLKNLTVGKFNNLPTNEKFIFFLVVVIVVLIVWKMIKEISAKSRLQHFLFNNNYHSVDPNTGKIIYPIVSFRKNSLVIINCSRKTTEQIMNEKELWQSIFFRELKNKRLAETRMENGKIIIALI